jgi:hypothetical protein
MRKYYKKKQMNIPMSLSKTKLTRQSHYNSSDDCMMFDNLVAGVPITKHEALDDIYHCFEMWMKGIGVRSISPDPIGYEYEEGEILEDEFVPMVSYWGNEFLFRDSDFDEGRETFRLVEEESLVYTEGIDEFRQNTHVVFKETSFGVMWKILPLSVDTFQSGQYDGCFTKNNDGIMDQMNMVDQSKLFGTFLDVTIENRTYILWSALCA